MPKRGESMGVGYRFSSGLQGREFHSSAVATPYPRFTLTAKLS
jgi:hypothetical protein